VTSCRPAVAALALALACGGAAPGHARAAHRDGGCTAGAAKALVRTFVRQYSSGRVAAVMPLWAARPPFEWFSTGGPGARLGARAHDRATLAAYFGTRVRVHERIRLVDLRAGYDAGRNIANFSGTLVRSADDLRPRRSPFKGAAGCASGRPLLIVWSM
jgi:hypothetical protein